jgi:hypothetical protein
MSVLEYIAGFLIGCLTVLTLVIAGLVLFIPDAARYLKLKNK